MFTELFVMVQMSKWETKCPTVALINKLWYIHPLGYLLYDDGNELLLRETTDESHKVWKKHTLYVYSLIPFT